MLYSCEGTKHNSIFSAVNLILKSYQANFITIHNPSAYLDVDIVGNIKLTNQAITVVNEFASLPLCCKNGPCSTKRRSYFGKVLLFFPSFTNSIESYYKQVEQNKKSEENPVSIFLIYFDRNKSVEYVSFNSRYKIMNVLYAAVFIVLVDKDWSPAKRSDVNKITIYCTNCMYCGGKIPKSIVQFDSTTDDFKFKLRQAQISVFNNGHGMIWRPHGLPNRHAEPVEKAVRNFLSFLSEGESIHPFLKTPSYPNHFSPAMHILLLNVTKHGIQNLLSLRGVMFACTNQIGADYSHYLALDVGTLERILYRYSSNHHTNFVMLRQYGFNFITCSGVAVKNEINAFIRPFDWITWTCLFITIGAIVAFLSHENKLNSVIYTFGALIEQSNRVLHIFKRKWYNLLIVLMFSIISGAYKGKILQFLMLLRQYGLTVTRIQDMVNFTFYSTEETFFFNNTFGDYRGKDMSQFQEVYTAYLKTREDYNETMLDKVRYMYYSEPDSWNTIGQRGYDYVKHCNATAYAGLLNTIDDNLNRANEMGKTDNIMFMKGADNFRPTGEFAFFDPHLDDIMARRLQRLIDNGIHFIWQKWIDIRYRTAKRPTTDNCKKPLRLNSDLMSLLLTVSILFVFASLIFCSKIVSKLFVMI